MSEKILNDMSCEACGSWEFECREDGESYCTSCSLPFVKKEDEPVKLEGSASQAKICAVGK